MSRSSPIAKLAKAARLNAEAQKLMLEAAEELAVDAEHETLTPTPPPGPVDGPRKVTDVDAARARRVLRRLGSPE